MLVSGSTSTALLETGHNYSLQGQYAAAYRQTPACERLPGEMLGNLRTHDQAQDDPGTVLCFACEELKTRSCGWHPMVL